MPWRPCANRLGVPESFTEKFAAGLASYGEQAMHRVRGPVVLRRRGRRLRRAIADRLREAGVPDDAPVGLVVRNRLPHAAAIIGFLAAGRPVSMIYSFQSPESIGRDIEKLNLSAIVADREDWTDEVIAAAKRAGSAGVAISLTTPHRRGRRGAGASRRIPSARRSRTRCGAADSDQRHHRPAEAAGDQDAVLERTVFSVTSGEAAPPDAPPEFSYWQFGGIGVCQLIAGVYNARRMVILERFTVDGFVNAVKTHASTAQACSRPSFACCSTPTCPRKTWRRWIS